MQASSVATIAVIMVARVVGMAARVLPITPPRGFCELERRLDVALVGSSFLWIR